MPMDVQRAWGWLAWFSLILAIAGLGDLILAWVPLRLGSPEWEFGTVVSTFAGLPLVSMGFAGLLASAVARGIRWQIITVGAVLCLFAVLILLAFVIFLLDVPLALQAGAGVARIGLYKAVAKTALLGTVFFIGYAVAGVGSLRYSLRAARSRPA